ncbi:extracellular solute-binding protein [Halorubrum sp. Atlit-8R]|uniref:extracellular solute-binding protein n=1 Tax=unclassified Halorubrum TaxID=2642239 RepID=UPI000EF1A8E5|nr:MULTISPECIES: extracellular solute-binding protein [unclassified Halorubrum]RLM62940.1 extracellular solute-binding protein [Halorubrum sp. Atlit-9R]RLM76677.1 extracellular solute-binding protein [Halorubrum sp. Atlit-8R]
MQSRSRRSVLATLAAGGGVGAAGCLGGGNSVSVLAAGSLAVVLDEHLGQRFEEETGLAVRGEYYGTNAVMRMVEDDRKYPDVVVSADARLLRDRLYDTHSAWDVSFASNAIGIAYAPDTRFGERLNAGDPWYEVAREADSGNFAISDPDLDPLGYRAIHAFRLAEREHGLDGFSETVTEAAYREPEEPQLLAGVETGNRAAAVVYRNMAADHGLPFHSFPDAYNFSNPEYADQYAEVSYTTDDGYTATGAPIVYNATVLESADSPNAGHEFVRFLANAGETLRENGFETEEFPRTHGEAPIEVSSE